MEPKDAKYDVFLNHRGPDVKTAFVAHLNHALREAGVVPFLDKESLVKGELAFDSIDNALAGARVHVAIFSKGYAESKYCLKELCDMLKSKKPVIPVFYDVEPMHLRRIVGGSFAAAFTEHRRRGLHVDVSIWRNALREAAAITGFELAAFSNEVELVEKIVARVLELLPARLPLPVARHPVGLEEPSSCVMDILNNMGGNMGVVGIYGMGGIGKTTLVQEVFNQEQSRFDSRCFLKEVKECKGATGVEKLQVKMVAALLHEDMKRSQRDFARSFDRIRQRKVFLVIDDIDDRKQFEELIPCLSGLGVGSRVLITSRDMHLLRVIMQDVPKLQKALYEVPVLNVKESQELFTRCAFGSDIVNGVDDAFHGLIDDIVKACGGVPLALEVMGGFLSSERNVECWKEAIVALRKNGAIMRILQMSYDGLVNGDDKRMFLEISCFLVGHPLRVAMEIWRLDFEAPNVSLERLKDKCLVKVDADGDCMSMHDLLRDMGRNVVIERANKMGDRSYLWDPEDAMKVVQKMQGSCNVVALTVAGMSKIGATTKAEAYASMKELRYLILDECLVEGDFRGWSKELRWLQWRHMHGEELPSGLELPSLVVLDLGYSESLTCVWPEEFEMESVCNDLRVLMLTFCHAIKKLPVHIGMLRRLKVLDLQCCASLEYLPDSLGDLSELEDLNLAHCSSLEKLPDNIVNMRTLKVLNFDGTRIKKLPVEFGSLQSLVHFQAKGSRLEELPESFSCLSRLEVLNLAQCFSLENLPDNIVNMRTLKVLNIDRTGIRKIPLEFGSLQSLVCFHARDSCLVELPESFSGLSKLEDLDLTGCRLKVVNFNHCSLDGVSGSWVSVDARIKLALVKKVEMNLMRTSRDPKTFQHLVGLRKLNMTRCGNLVYLGGLPKSLSWLNLEGCVKLKRFEALDTMTSLVFVSLLKCFSLSIVPHHIPRNRSLQRCVLNQSEVSMEYDSNWMERSPALQVVSFSGSSFKPYLGEGLLRSVEWTVSSSNPIIEIPITRREECIAILFFFTVQGKYHCGYHSFVKVVIVRDNLEILDVEELDVFSYPGIWVGTFRRHHSLVQKVQFGDKIRVYIPIEMKVRLSSLDSGEMRYLRRRITEVAVCVVHNIREDLEKNSQVVVVNGIEKCLDTFKAKLHAQPLMDDIKHSWEAISTSS